MNFLAHIYLSGNNQKTAIGNFIGDNVRKKDWELFEKEIKTGVLLHHEIDRFTDNHPIFKKGVDRLRPSLKKYAPVALDVFYDHFLAKHFEKHSTVSLEVFTQNFYESLNQNIDTMPEKAQMVSKYLIKYDWLNAYKTIDGIQMILNQMSNRTKFDSNLNNASIELINNYNVFETEFKLFFEEIKTHAAKELKRIIDTQ